MEEMKVIRVWSDMKAIENNGRIYPVLKRNVLLISQVHDIHKHMTGSHVLWGLFIDTYFYTIQSNTLLKKIKTHDL